MLKNGKINHSKKEVKKIDVSINELDDEIYYNIMNLSKELPISLTKNNNQQKNEIDTSLTDSLDSIKPLENLISPNKKIINNNKIDLVSPMSSLCNYYLHTDSNQKKWKDNKKNINSITKNLFENINYCNNKYESNNINYLKIESDLENKGNVNNNKRNVYKKSGLKNKKSSKENKKLVISKIPLNNNHNYTRKVKNGTINNKKDKVNNQYNKNEATLIKRKCISERGVKNYENNFSRKSSNKNKGSFISKDSSNNVIENNKNNSLKKECHLPTISSSPSLHSNKKKGKIYGIIKMVKSSSKKKEAHNNVILNNTLHKDTDKKIDKNKDNNNSNIKVINIFPIYYHNSSSNLNKESKVNKTKGGLLNTLINNSFINVNKTLDNKKTNANKYQVLEHDKKLIKNNSKRDMKEKIRIVLKSKSKNSRNNQCTENHTFKSSTSLCKTKYTNNNIKVNEKKLINFKPKIPNSLTARNNLIGMKSKNKLNTPYNSNFNYSNYSSNSKKSNSNSKKYNNMTTTTQSQTSKFTSEGNEKLDANEIKSNIEYIIHKENFVYKNKIYCSSFKVLPGQKCEECKNISFNLVSNS